MDLKEKWNYARNKELGRGYIRKFEYLTVCPQCLSIRPFMPCTPWMEHIQPTLTDAAEGLLPPLSSAPVSSSEAAWLDLAWRVRPSSPRPKGVAFLPISPPRRSLPPSSSVPLCAPSGKGLCILRCDLRSLGVFLI